MDIKLSKKYYLFVEGYREDYLLFDDEEYVPLYKGVYNKYEKKALMINQHMPWIGEYRETLFYLRSWKMEERGVKQLYEISIV